MASLVVQRSWRATSTLPSNTSNCKAPRGPGFGGRSAGQAAIAIASNEAFSGWTKTFIDPRHYAAIVDRLALAGQIIIETGTQSYRLAQARAQRGHV